MIKYNSNNINDWDFGTSNIIKVYHNNAVCYYKVVAGETAQTPCYAVVNDITQYQDTEFENVFNKADNKWYKLNNLNEYEEYGVYGSGRTECSGGTPTSRLPQGYTEVEYIENTGTSYINTNVVLYSSSSNSFILKGKIAPQFTQGDGDNQTFINSESVSSPYYGFSWRFNNNGGFKFDVNPSGSVTLSADTLSDGASAFTITASQVGATDNVPLGLFCSYNNSSYTSTYRPSKGKLYSLEITLNNEIVRNYVPAKRDSGNKYGLYDLVTNTFYLSPNNVDFSGGDPITPTECVTTYEGKLTIDGDYEYQYSGNSWNNVGEISGSTYPMYYDEMQDPPTQVSFSSMTEAEQYECPYVGLMATINGDLYIFNDNYQWELIPTPSSPKWLATYTGGTTSSAECDSTSAITANEITKTNLESVVIGDCVTSIGNQTFYGCSSLTSVTIGSGLTSIGYAVFYYCTSLTNCTIGSGVTSIGTYAFGSCSSLTSIDIPDSVTFIDRFAFIYCTSLSSIDIPNSVTSVGIQAFNGCTGLTSVTVNATTPPTLGTDVFYDTNNCPIYVPSESVETYKAASGWSDYSSRIQAKP